MHGENEDLLQKLNVYNTDLKTTVMEKSAVEKMAAELKAKCEKMQKAADKALEMEASVICLKEKEGVYILETKSRGGDGGA